MALHVTLFYVGGNACQSIFTHRPGGWNSKPKVDVYLPLNRSDKQISQSIPILDPLWRVSPRRSLTDGLIASPFTWGRVPLGTTGQHKARLIAPAFLALHQQYTPGRVPGLPVPNYPSAALLEELTGRTTKMGV